MKHLRALHRDDAGRVLAAVLQQQQRVVDQLVDGRLEMTPTMPHMVLSGRQVLRDRVGHAPTCTTKRPGASVPGRTAGSAAFGAEAAALGALAGALGVGAVSMGTGTGAGVGAGAGFAGAVVRVGSTRGSADAAGSDAAGGATLAAGAGAAAEAAATSAAGRDAGIDSGAAPSREGIWIGMSTGIGRGCVSNSSGKAITPAPSNTTAPTSRRRA
jgi:hypothetical protein